MVDKVKNHFGIGYFKSVFICIELSIWEKKMSVWNNSRNPP